MRSDLGVALAALVLGLAAPAAAVVAGGGSGRSDCYAVFEGVTATKKNKVVCTDGDPACDRDGACQGTCRFDVRACFHQDGPRCVPKRVIAIRKNTLELDLPATPISRVACGAVTAVPVAVRHKKGRRKGRLVTQVDGRPRIDTDRIVLECRKRTGRCPTTTSMVDTTTTTTTTPPCVGGPCPIGSPGRYTITQASGGTLTVDGLPAFAFPSGGAIVQDIGCPDINTCVHDVVVPFPGGFSAPVFCVPALLFTVAVRQTGCGIGKLDSDGGSDFTVRELGDTSDASQACNLPHAACANGADSSVRVDLTVGDGTADSCSSGTANALLSVPVLTTTWQEAGFQCPDPDGTFDVGTDNLVVAFPQTLDFTTDTTRATWTDLDADGCSRAGAGPGGAGLAGTGSCLDLGTNTITTAASGPIGSSGAPLYDLTFRTVLPSVLGGPFPFEGATCVSPPTAPLEGGAATRCVP